MSVIPAPLTVLLLLPPLRHSSDRVNQLEALVETYKTKLEDLGDLRRQVRLLEERNTVYMQRTCELEEELRRANAVRGQLDTYKRQAGGVILVPVLMSGRCQTQSGSRTCLENHSACVANACQCRLSRCSLTRRLTSFTPSTQPRP